MNSSIVVILRLVTYGLLLLNLFHVGHGVGLFYAYLLFLIEPAAFGRRVFFSDIYCMLLEMRIRSLNGSYVETKQRE